MRYLVVSFLGMLALTDAPSADWPRWRGPDQTGISPETDWLREWPTDGPPIRWSASVGVGFSSMAVADGRVFTLGNEDGQDTVFCLNAETGEPIWTHAYDADLGDMYFEGGPTSTPTVDGDAVYTLSRWGDLFCFDVASGDVRWSMNVAEETGAPIPTWGFAGSPVVYRNLLLLNVGQAGMALQKDSGEVVWKSAAEEAGYSTPYLFEWKGKTWALFSSGNTFSAVHPETAEILWEFEWITRYGVNAADPIVHGDHVFLSSGYNKGCTLLKMEPGEPTEVWRNRELRNQMNPSVLIDGYLYGFDGDATSRASLRCLEWATGEVRWLDEEVGLGSLTAADGNLIVLTAEGELLVGPATPEGEYFQPTARAPVLEGKCWTVPVLANGRIYCRNAEGDLVCLDVR